MPNTGVTTSLITFFFFNIYLQFVLQLYAYLLTHLDDTKEKVTVVFLKYFWTGTYQGKVQFIHEISPCFDWWPYCFFKSNLACKLNPSLISFYNTVSSFCSPALTSLYSFPYCSATIKNVLIQNSQYYWSLQHNYQFTEKATTKTWKVHNIISIYLFLYLPTAITHHLYMSVPFLVVVLLNFPALW